MQAELERNLATITVKMLIVNRYEPEFVNNSTNILPMVLVQSAPVNPYVVEST
jgi:hypothetical protein